MRHIRTITSVQRTPSRAYDLDDVFAFVFNIINVISGVLGITSAVQTLKAQQEVIDDSEVDTLE